MLADSFVQPGAAGQSGVARFLQLLNPEEGISIVCRRTLSEERL